MTSESPAQSGQPDRPAVRVLAAQVAEVVITELRHFEAKEAKLLEASRGGIQGPGCQTKGPSVARTPFQTNLLKVGGIRLLNGLED